MVLRSASFYSMPVYGLCIGYVSLGLYHSHTIILTSSLPLLLSLILACRLKGVLGGYQKMSIILHCHKFCRFGIGDVNNKIIQISIRVLVQQWHVLILILISIVVIQHHCSSSQYLNIVHLPLSWFVTYSVVLFGVFINPRVGPFIIVGPLFFNVTVPCPHPCPFFCPCQAKTLFAFSPTGKTHNY